MLMIILFACATQEAEINKYDRDRDGFITSSVDGGTDCDDDNSNINPSRPEMCDGTDQDCDGIIDNDASDATIFFIDSDGDGFGEEPILACLRPAESSTNNQDCDDSNAGINPNAIERCDGNDTDCNGQIEDGLPTTSYFMDVDRDGFGDPTTMTSSCKPLEDHVLNPDDCDDTNESVSPLAKEVYYDGVDQNCDALSDFDADEDGSDIPADCDDSSPDVSPLQPETCQDGLDNDCVEDPLACQYSGTIYASDIAKSTHPTYANQISIWPDFGSVAKLAVATDTNILVFELDSSGELGDQVASWEVEAAGKLKTHQMPSSQDSAIMYWDQLRPGLCILPKVVDQEQTCHINDFPSTFGRYTASTPSLLLVFDPGAGLYNSFSTEDEAYSTTLVPTTGQFEGSLKSDGWTTIDDAGTFHLLAHLSLTGTSGIYSTPLHSGTHLWLEPVLLRHTSPSSDFAGATTSDFQAIMLVETTNTNSINLYISDTASDRASDLSSPVVSWTDSSISGSPMVAIADINADHHADVVYSAKDSSAILVQYGPLRSTTTTGQPDAVIRLDGTLQSFTTSPSAVAPGSDIWYVEEINNTRSISTIPAATE